jgi:hypothetical protein
MSYILSYTARFFGCAVAFGLVTRLVLALPMAQFGSIAGLADVANALSILIALIATYQLSERLKKQYAHRAALSSTEAAWAKWLTELEKSKRTVITAAEPLLKNVA